MQNSFVYWITDDIQSDISTHGYVGVTNVPKIRYNSHKKSKRFPISSFMEIIFEGTRVQCFDIETMLRPSKRIGWNSAPGGQNGFKHGFVHSMETRNHLKTTWTSERRLQASLFAAEHNIKMRGQKRPKQSIAISGNKNPMYGKLHTDKAKEKISKAHKNKIPWNKSDNICLLCNKPASSFIQKKYHGVGKKNCIGKL